jgi:hypothetical protein
VLLAIPYNSTLPGGYDKLTDAIKRLGRHPGHTLIVLSTVEHEEGAFEFAMGLKDYFGRYFAVTLPDQPESMLKTSNRVFRAAMTALHDYLPTPTEHPEPVMLYMDPTWRPTQKRWLDEFQTEYYFAGAPLVYGRIKTDKTKARVDGPVAINVKFVQQSTLIDFVPDDTHWRDYLAWEMFKVSVKAPSIGKVLPAYIRPLSSP